MRKAKATNSLSAGARRREPSVGRSAGNADVSVSYARGALRARLWVDVLCEPTWPGGAFCRALTRRPSVTRSCRFTRPAIVPRKPS